jgi:hypothetical protein
VRDGQSATRRVGHSAELNVAPRSPIIGNVVDRMRPVGRRLNARVVRQ